MHKPPSLKADLISIDNDRAADNWDALLRIAALLGEGWSQKATTACARITDNLTDDSDDGDISIKLLEDIRSIFFDFNLTRIHSFDLVERLLHLEESPWNTTASGKPIDQSWVANKLKAYGIKSAQLKINGRNKRGFRIEDFLDAWNRYLLSTCPTEDDMDATRATELKNMESATSCYPPPRCYPINFIKNNQVAEVA